MSRCFPFPPPGYERKVGADNVSLLKQDKHREKKHRKEKRDKEKREGKEKKENRGDEKHRNKKAKKDKHRDKKDKEKDKKKNKERERDRSSTSNEKNQYVQVGHFNQEKHLDQKESRSFPALQAAEKSTQKEKDKIRNSIPDSKRSSITLDGQNGERIVSANHVAARVSDAKCIQELAKRLKNDQSSGSEQASAIPERKKNNVKGQLLGKAVGAGLEVKEKTNDRIHNNEKKMDERVIKEQTGLNGTVKVQSFGETPGRTKHQEIAKPSNVNAKEMECRETMTVREGDDIRGDKLKVQYLDQRKGMVKESRKKEERSKEKSEQKHSDQEKLKAGNTNGVLGSAHLNSIQPMKEPNRTVAAEGNLKKRKAETNGFMLGDEVGAKKLHKQAQIFQPPVENRVETHQISTKMTPRPKPVNHVKVNKDENKINGVKGAAHTSPISPLYHHPSSAAQAVLLLAEASSSGPPHPDSKFLGEILKVPNLDDLPDLDDDQGWLFHIKKQDFKNSNERPSSIFRGTPEVWGESLYIESVDIHALPYVFPY